MKLNNRRLMSVLLLLAVTLYTVIGLTAALCEPTDPNEGEKDPYDWSDYEGEIILDDPEFFLFDDETVDENEPVPDSGESVSSSDPDALDENTQPGTGDNTDLNEEQTDPTNEPESPTDEQSEGEEPPAEEPTTEPEKPVDLKSLFQVEIKVPAGWFNLPDKAVRLKITPKSEALWDKIFCRLDDGEWVEIKDRFSFHDGYYYIDLTVTANGSMSVRLMDAAGNYFDTQKEIRIFDHRPPEVTAGIKNTMLHVVAVDDLSEVAGIQVNGLLLREESIMPDDIENGLTSGVPDKPEETEKEVSGAAFQTSKEKLKEISDHEIVEEGNELALHPAHHVSRHGAENSHQRAHADREHEGVPQGSEEVHLIERLGIVFVTMRVGREKGFMANWPVVFRELFGGLFQLQHGGSVLLRAYTDFFFKER